MKFKLRNALICVFLFSSLVVIWWQWTASERSLTLCKKNLKRLGLAMDSYHSSYSSFPSAFSPGPLPQSWRVSILPSLDQKSLYDAYNPMQAWNVGANRMLLSQRPSEFACPELQSSTPEKTSYLAVLGVQTAWPYETPSRFRDFTDGSSNTGIVMDLHEFATEWTRPADVEYAEIISAAKKSQPHSLSQTPSVFNMLFADGSVRSVSSEVDESVIRMVLTPSGGRPLLEGREALERSIGVSEAFPMPVDCSSLNATELSPIPGNEILPGRSILYCPTMALAWQEYTQRVQQVRETELGKQLSESRFSTKDISSDSLEVEVNMDETDGPSVRCRLTKHLAFAAVFDSFYLPLTFLDSKGSHKVKSFGVTSHWVDWRFALAQVRVYDYRSPDDFVISIDNLNNEDLILAKIPQPTTLESGIHDVERRIRESTMPLDGREVIAEEDLVIPVLELSVFGDFMSDLNHPDQPPGSRLQKARQELQFRLDERGAVVHSEAELIGENGAYGGYVPGTRAFVFDKPFLIMLRESPDKQPYFAGWIGNTDLMRPPVNE